MLVKLLLPVVALSVLSVPASGYAQAASASVAQAHYDEDQKCLGVYLFMTVAERALPPANIQVYTDLATADGHAVGRTDDQIKTDMRSAIMDYANAIKAQSTDDKIPANAGWDDYKACNAYFAARGITPTPPAVPQPRSTGDATSSSQP